MPIFFFSVLLRSAREREKESDVLIDDHDFNLSTFVGRTIMFSCAHNMNETKHERLDNWLDAEKLFDLK